MTARGALPCCAVKKVSRIFSRVVRSYAGLVSVEFDTVLCAGCVTAQRLRADTPPPHTYNIKSLVAATCDQRNLGSPEDKSVISAMLV